MDFRLSRERRGTTVLTSNFTLECLRLKNNFFWFSSKVYCLVAGSPNAPEAWPSHITTEVSSTVSVSFLFVQNIVSSPMRSCSELHWISSIRSCVFLGARVTEQLSVRRSRAAGPARSLRTVKSHDIISLKKHQDAFPLSVCRKLKPISLHECFGLGCVLLGFFALGWSVFLSFW